MTEPQSLKGAEQFGASLRPAVAPQSGKTLGPIKDALVEPSQATDLMALTRFASGPKNGPCSVNLTHTQCSKCQLLRRSDPDILKSSI